ncbi:hypothetical protein [Enterococcus sp. DIV0170]|uniref:hypothetical protein n=1 Tax=Enterococcus sp. DIV0170 TaxID=2774642 RepID=UPI003F258796
MKKILLVFYTLTSLCFILTGCKNSNKEIASFKDGTITVNDFYKNPKVRIQNKILLHNMIVYKAFDDVYGDKVSTKEIDKEYDKQNKNIGSDFEANLKA